MSVFNKLLLVDHIETRDLIAASSRRFEDVLVVVILAIHTTAVVTLPHKLAGGELPGLGFIWMMGGVLSLVFAGLNLKHTARIALHAWPVLLLTLWAWCSYAWTVDPYETLRGCVLITCSHLFAFALAARFSWERLIELLAWTLVGLVGLSVLLALGLPSIGRMQDTHIGAWSGVWLEKQLLGIFACHGLIAALSMVSMGRAYQWWWIGVIVCVVAIIGSTGITAILMSLIAIFMGIWLRIFNRDVLSAIIVGWIGIIAGGLGVLVVSGGLEFIVQLLGRTPDFTGRTDVWEAVKKLGDMHPNRGWGFYAIWRGEDVMTSPYQWVMDWTGFKPANAHSSWLDIYAELGRPGLALLVLCVGWAWLGAFFRPPRNAVAVAFAGANLMAITFISFTETNLMRSMDLQWMLVVLIGTKLFGTYTELTPTRLPSVAGGNLVGNTFTYNNQRAAH